MGIPRGSPSLRANTGPCPILRTRARATTEDQCSATTSCPSIGLPVLSLQTRSHHERRNLSQRKAKESITSETVQSGYFSSRLMEWTYYCQHCNEEWRDTTQWKCENCGAAWKKPPRPRSNSAKRNEKRANKRTAELDELKRQIQELRTGGMPSALSSEVQQAKSPPATAQGGANHQEEDGDDPLMKKIYKKRMAINALSTDKVENAAIIGALEADIAAIQKQRFEQLPLVKQIEIKKAQIDGVTEKLKEDQVQLGVLQKSIAARSTQIEVYRGELLALEKLQVSSTLTPGAVVLPLPQVEAHSQLHSCLQQLAVAQGTQGDSQLATLLVQFQNYVALQESQSSSASSLAASSLPAVYSGEVVKVATSGTKRRATSPVSIPIDNSDAEQTQIAADNALQAMVVTAADDYKAFQAAAETSGG